jgi:hypothetical protein
MYRELGRVVVEGANLEWLLFSIALALEAGPVDDWDTAYVLLTGMSVAQLCEKIPRLTRVRQRFYNRHDDDLIERLRAALSEAQEAYNERSRLVHSTWHVTTHTELTGAVARWRMRRGGPLGYLVDQGYVSVEDITAVADNLQAAGKAVEAVLRDVVKAGLVGPTARMADET